MKKTPISEFVKKHSITTVANALNCSPAAVCIAIQKGRKILVWREKGALVAEETKPFPRSRKERL